MCGQVCKKLGADAVVNYSDAKSLKDKVVRTSACSGVLEYRHAREYRKPNPSPAVKRQKVRPAVQLCFGTQDSIARG
jgi:hypothetical protein